MTQIAFYGLGTMGLPMARNLVAAGYEWSGTIWSRTGRARSRGGRAEIAIASLPSAAAVEEVALGLPGAASRCSSTCRPGLRLCAALADELGAAGIKSLDAPVTAVTRRGGGNALDLRRRRRGDVRARRPVLRALGSVVAHVGAGRGAGREAVQQPHGRREHGRVAEACAVAAREGLDPRLFYELVTHSTGDSRVLRTRYPWPARTSRIR